MPFSKYGTIFDLWSINNQDVSPDEFYLNYIARLRQQADQGDMNALGTIPTAQAEYNFYLNKKPTYKVYPSMAIALASTNIEIPSEEINVPFRFFEIQLQSETFFLDDAWYEDFKDQFVEEQGHLSGAPYLGSLLVALAESAPREMGRPGGRSRYPPGTKNLIIHWDVKDTKNPNAFLDSRSQILLIPNQSVAYGAEELSVQAIEPAAIDKQRVAALVVGIIFMAISHNREWVQRSRIKLRGRDWCLCGSGRRYRRCCAKTKNKAGQPIGFTVGKTIDLPYTASSSTGIYIEGRGDELQYSHIRSGHMRWQWKNDPQGNRIRELIFIAPTIVRPDLRMKPKLTPRQIRPERQRKPWNR